MDDHLANVAKACLHGAETNSMTFPEIVKILIDEGFESYMVDFRRNTVIYYHQNGSSIELAKHRLDAAISAEFNASALQSAIREAQQLVPGYTYKGFSEKVMAAGCVGYIVSFPGKRAVYFGRTAEMHVEHFPRPGT